MNNKIISHSMCIDLKSNNVCCSCFDIFVSMFVCLLFFSTINFKSWQEKLLIVIGVMDLDFTSYKIGLNI